MRKITVGMLLFPGFQMLDIAGPTDAFAEVKVLSGGACEYELVTVGTTRGPVQSSSRLTIVPDRTIFDACPHFDTLIIPGGPGIFRQLEDTTVIDWVRERSHDCRRVGAICNGLFALGAAGLLNGKTVTTHWMDVARLASMFKRAVIEPDRIYVKDGATYTTAGVTAGIDLSLVFIEEDFGADMALAVARYLVVYLRRSGGQSQFSPLLEVRARAGKAMEYVLGHVADRLDERHTLESIAAGMDVSPRHLTRMFKKECAMTPMSFVNDLRIEMARRLLESTDLAMNDIARRCGVDNADGLRRMFTRRLDVTPADYRLRFRSGAAQA